MKKALGVTAACIVVGYLGAVSYLHFFDKAQAKKQLEQMPATTPQARQIGEILFSNGCGYCHGTSTEKPFYSNLPIIKDIVQDDIKDGEQAFLLSNITDNLDHPERISQADLAKLQTVISDGSMPPALFKHMHWGAGLNEKQKTEVLAWIRATREADFAKYYPKGMKGVDPSRLVQPLPDSIPVDQKKALLGELLFHDVRISGNNTIACSSCHGLDTGGVDNLKTSTGIHGQKGGINAPTVYNAVFNIAQFWDGRAKDLQDQAGGPPLNPVEMGSKDWNQIIAKLDQDTHLKEMFLKVYPNGFSAASITDAIAEFEKTLITPNSPFDQYLKGDKKALTAQQIHGYELFQENKCSSCHTGIALGGQSYEYMGLEGDYFKDRSSTQKDGLTDADKGRFAVTKDPRDMHRFKVPTLRNVSLTGPYMHDASVPNLKEAVQVMLKYQVGKTLPDSDVNDIVAFLDSLTGDMKKPLSKQAVQASLLQTATPQTAVPQSAVKQVTSAQPAAQ